MKSLKKIGMFVLLFTGLYIILFLFDEIRFRIYINVINT